MTQVKTAGSVRDEMANSEYHPEWLELESLWGSRPLLAGTVEDLLKQFVELGTKIVQLSPASPRQVESLVQSRDEDINDNIRCRVYTPTQKFESRLPVGVYYHAGGYVLGSLDSDDALCRYIATSVQCIIVSIDYRLGPTHKLPTMTNDCIIGFNWTWENCDKLGGDPRKIFTVGTSAGGGLALSVADALIRSGKRTHIRGIVALVPVAVHPKNIPAGYDQVYTAYSQNANAAVIDKSTMETFFNCVDCNPEDATTFTSLSTVLGYFPPTYIATCGKDPLRDDGIVMNLMLQKAGVKTKLNHYAGFPHCFWIFPNIPTAGKFLKDVVDGVKMVLSSSVTEF